MYLIINSGSSSIKFQVFKDEESVLKGHVDGIGLDSCKLKMNGSEEIFFAENHESALKEIFKHINMNEIEIIGHRVVHGGEKYTSPVIIDEEVIKKIEELCVIAPLHNPANLQGIVACKNITDKPQIAIFDTGFHQTLPKESYLYAIPYKEYEELKVRKYGFHGISHNYLYEKAKEHFNRDVNVISCHLGNGASIACIKKGNVVDTSMGFTPLQGLVMGTRSGDIDPGLLIYLQKVKNMNPDEICNYLNKESGLKGISGFSDVRLIHKKSEEGDERCKLALNMFVFRLRQYIGSYLALMGEKTDAIIFSGGIGEGAEYIRMQVCKNLEHLGLMVDETKNNNHEYTVSKDDSPIKIMVIPTNEELMMVKEIKKIINK